LLFWAVSFQETVRQQEEKLQIIAENISDGIYRSAPGEGLLYANQAFAEMFGYESVEDILTVEPGSLYASPAIRDAARRQAEEQGTLGPLEIELQRKDGSTFTGLLRGSVVWDEDGLVQFYDGVVTDITQRKRRERELARRKAMLEAQAEATIDGLLVVDNERDISFYNERFLEIWDIPKNLVNRSPTEVSLDQVLLEAVTDLLSNPDEFREKVEYLYDYPDESSRDLIRLTDGRWIDRYSAPIGGEDGAHFGRLWVFRDVAEQQRREQQLRHEATHDELTGLLNRAALHDELEALIGDDNRETLSALLYLDLDDFKQVNDRLGHNVGDRVLGRVADRLETVVRDTDLVARLGGDEFVVCLTEAADAGAVGRVAKRIYDELGEAFEVEGQEVYAPPSIGVVTRLARFESVDDALCEADTAMYEAKRASETARQPDRPFVVSESSTSRRIDADLSAGEPSR
jgi:diguanylate cyclase (GGDEF)-like protein/PAS domain S-box-containing protein